MLPILDPLEGFVDAFGPPSTNTEGLHLTSFHPLLPVCREAVEEHGERWVLPENMVSNGPYWLEEWEFNSSLRLRKNPHYWETEVHAGRRIRELELLCRFGSFAGRGLATIEALSVEELNTALNLYLTGDMASGSVSTVLSMS